MVLAAAARNLEGADAVQPVKMVVECRDDKRLPCRIFRTQPARSWNWGPRGLANLSAANQADTASGASSLR